MTRTSSRRPPAAVRVHACAKINLTLRVLGIRPDGYHELRTTFQSLALRDTLTFTHGDSGFAIDTNDPECPTGPPNLVWKAAQALWQAIGRRGEVSGVHVRLHKRVPAQAGLGGGSSDAAATLRGLCELWRVDPADVDLPALARGLGADVAYFLAGGAALGVERGDRLFPLQDADPAWVVLARPDFGVSTRDAYAWWDADRGAEPGRLIGPPAGRRDPELVNDLEAPVGARHPRIARIVRRMAQLGADRASMSGSGSAVFGLFASRSSAVAAAGVLSGPSTAVWVTRTVSRREYQALSHPVLRAR